MNTDEVKIRKATLSDLEQLYIFEQNIIQAERPFDPTLKRERTNYYDLKEMITAVHVEVVVAESDNRIIGSGYARIEKSKTYLQHSNHAYLGFMYVLPEFRGKGINKRIIETLQDWAMLQNVPELRLEVYYENINAIKAYEKIGFSKHMLQMRLKLDEKRK
ncbi:MAG: GNAT family N-acetyltransferase [Chitinophagales bacterium]